MNSTVSDKIKVPQALWDSLKTLGVSLAELLRRAQIPLGAIRDGNHISTSQFFEMWRLLPELSSRPDIGIYISSVIEGSMLPPSFMAAYHAKDFRDSLQRVSRFKRLCAPEEININEAESLCFIEIYFIHAEKAEMPPALVDATFASLVELGRKGADNTINPHAVELTRSPQNRPELENYFGCRIRFKCKSNRIVFKSKDLDKTFKNYNKELLEILLPALESRLEEQKHSLTLADQVKWILRKRLTAGRPDIRSVASELSMSGRTLQRRLTDESLNFQNLVSETRHQLALEYLMDSSLSLIEVAFMLGYEDQNSFFRAFRLWEKQTPSEWRNTHLQ